VAPEVLPRLFQPFVQADDTLARGQGGLGLGLVLVKAIVELHGGQINARSDGLTKGTEFVLTLPLAQALPAQNPERRGRPAPSSRRMLVIDDNVDAANALQFLLKVVFRVREIAIAHTGPEGLEKARTFRPELVLCDIGLPGMDGYAVARAIRADPDLRDARLVAVSGYAQPGDVRRAIDAGFEWHVAKPLEVEEMEKILRQVESETPLAGRARQHGLGNPPGKA
jgi:two-component system CheB/CheR fusion protein